MIDRHTVDQIIQAANIVEVVSDFVNLHRRGANYVGLCPFHNEKTPSFYVTPSKGFCHCFGCGKGGTPVNFIMEHEQISYYEALKYLAKKYHIEIHERELTPAEIEAQSEREGMLVVNEFARTFFEDQLHNTPEGRDVGLAYFRERGFTDETIKKFHLGYSPQNRSALYDAAVEKGYSKNLLFGVGLSINDNHGGGFDRFRDRVIFPVYNVAGKVVAFGGRIMRQVKNTGKYLNSPESVIYSKKHELYGLFHAKHAIIKQAKCFLVEGYTDVISMHQAGIENVVASSGTSLTTEQTRLIHRFTENVTILYDGDSAGIHASLRGINMLLAEGLNIKVLLLPDGEDPDSFARSHSATEFINFINQNETDFIRFKMQILLKDANNDITKMKDVITDIEETIAVIPSAVLRSLYARECSNTMQIAEEVLLADISSIREKNKVKEQTRKANQNQAAANAAAGDTQAATERQPAQQVPAERVNHPTPSANPLYQHEWNIVRYVVKFGMMLMGEANFDDGVTHTPRVIEYIQDDLRADGLTFSSQLLAKMFNAAVNCIPAFYDDFNDYISTLNEQGAEAFRRLTTYLACKYDMDSDKINDTEQKLQNAINAKNERRMKSYTRLYLERVLCNDPDDEIRALANEMANDEQPLSKIHTQTATIVPEEDKLNTLVPKAINVWKYAVIKSQISNLQQELKSATDTAMVMQLMQQIKDLTDFAANLSKLIGERVVNPL